MAEQALITAKYDDVADVLYVSLGKRSPARYEEDDHGLVWRFDAAGERYGVTVMDYHAYWTRRLDRLTDAVSHNLRLPFKTVREALLSR